MRNKERIIHLTQGIGSDDSMLCEENFPHAYIYVEALSDFFSEGFKDIICTECLEHPLALAALCG